MWYQLLRSIEFAYLLSTFTFYWRTLLILWGYFFTRTYINNENTSQNPSGCFSFFSPSSAKLKQFILLRIIFLRNFEIFYMIIGTNPLCTKALNSLIKVQTFILLGAISIFIIPCALVRNDHNNLPYQQGILYTVVFAESDITPQTFTEFSFL